MNLDLEVYFLDLQGEESGFVARLRHKGKVVWESDTLASWQAAWAKGRRREIALQNGTCRLREIDPPLPEKIRLSQSEAKSRTKP